MGKTTLQLFTVITALFILVTQSSAKDEIPVQLSYSSSSSIQSNSILREDVSCSLKEEQQYSTQFEWRTESVVTTSPSTNDSLTIQSKATYRELIVNGKEIEPFEPLGLTKVQIQPTGQQENFHSGTLVRELPRLPLVFSEKTVKKGDSWTIVFDETVSFPLKTPVTYTLKNLTSDDDGNKAIITASCQLSTELPKRFLKVSLKANANFVFDLDSGTLLKGSGNSDYSLVWTKELEGLPCKRVRKGSFTTTNSLIKK